MSLNILAKPAGWDKFSYDMQFMMAMITVTVGIGEITKANSEKFYNRLHAWELMHGAFRTTHHKIACSECNQSLDPLYSQEEVDQLIGLKTNACFKDETAVQFRNKMCRTLIEQW